MFEGRMLTLRQAAILAALIPSPTGDSNRLLADEPLPAVVEPDPRLSEPAKQPRAADPPESFTPAPEFQQWITNLVREQLPDNYEKRKNWGHTAKSFDRLAVEVDEGRLETRRIYKQANDGDWQLYRIKLTDPAEQFEIRIANVRQLENGKVGLEVTATANLEVFGRQSLWQHGVQLYSLSAEADARVRLWASAEIATHVDLTRFPPDLSLDPIITAARFEIPDFRIRRLGALHGPLIRSLSHSTREALEAKLAEDNDKIVAKLNRAIDKQEKKLRLSLADIVSSKWRGLLEDKPAP
jgi:hypothetical protein